MLDLLRTLFSSDGFMPHGHCYLWDPGVVWLHVISDALIFLAYCTIPITLIHIVRQRKDIPFNWIFFCFGIFVLACGVTHFMEIVTLWKPVYWLSGLTKAVTAVASVSTAILLVRLVPLALAVPSREALEREQQLLAQANADLKASQDSLVQAERLAAVGQLAASVAHEVRNPLAAVRGAVGYVTKQLGADPQRAVDDPRVKQFLGIIDREVNVVMKIVSDLLDFARERPPTFAPCLVRSVVAEALSIIVLPPGRNVALVNEVAEDFAPPEADADLIRQAVVNLVQNAVEAIPAGRDGRVSVAASASNGKWELKVQDDGAGIPEAVRAKVFQPLFTTKTKGTGLGLAIVASIAKRHNGTARLESEGGKGTLVVLELPVVPAAAATASSGSGSVLPSAVSPNAVSPVAQPGDAWVT